MLAKVIEEALDTALFVFSMVLVYDECDPRKVCLSILVMPLHDCTCLGTPLRLCRPADDTTGAEQRDFHRLLHI